MCRSTLSENSFRLQLPRYHIVLEDAHERLARLCMAYISFCLEEMKDCIQRSSNATRERDLVLSTSYASRPLLKYVLSDGFSHLAHLGPGNTGYFQGYGNPASDDLPTRLGVGQNVQISSVDSLWDSVAKFGARFHDVYPRCLCVRCSVSHIPRSFCPHTKGGNQPARICCALWQDRSC
jgi:hypothetical protein